MRKLLGRVVSAALIICWAYSATALAADGAALNGITAVQAQLDGGRVLLKVQFSQPLTATPGNWSTAEPARIVFDFPETENRTGKTTQQINSGDLHSINLVQADRLTRLVLNLNRSSGYSISQEGSALYISLEPFKADKGAAPQAVAPSLIRELAKSPLSEPALMRDLTFRRGADGQAQIMVDLSDGTVPLDIRRSGTGLAIDIQNTEIPERLLSRRDVNDFGTPVTSITTSVGVNQAHIDIAAKGRWIHQAQMVNNQLVIEIKPLTVDEANKLVPAGEEGKKISVNFYDAELPMVLRTLAELSKRNVIVDPSLNGRKITVTLDNMPYDQALEVVMTQTGAAMRVRDNLVIFAARDVLLKRDADLADERARENQTAPLVTESFQLNYIKASEVMKLVMLAQSDTSNSNPTPHAVTTPQASGGATTTVTNLPRGIMSPRGSISNHDVTNKLFVRDTQAVVDQIRNLIKEVDVPPKQVLVEARIVEVSTDFTRNLGVRLNFYNNSKYGIGGTGYNAAFGTASTSSFSNVNLFGTSGTPTLTATTTKGFGAPYSLSGGTTLNMMLFNSAATRLITMELAASETDNKSKTVSSPRVVTQNRKAATINFTQQITLIVGVNAQTGLPIYQTYSAPLSLDVTPAITPDNRVNIDLKITKSTLNLASGGANTVSTNTLNTNVIVENGGTVVIGGFYIEGESSSVDRIPFLGDLPYVGFLFKNTQTLRNKSELLVFITPRVLSENMALR